MFEMCLPGPADQAIPGTAEASGEGCMTLQLQNDYLVLDMQPHGKSP